MLFNRISHVAPADYLNAVSAHKVAVSEAGGLKNRSVHEDWGSVLQINGSYMQMSQTFLFTCSIPVIPGAGSVGTGHFDTSPSADSSFALPQRQKPLFHIH
jgi:hypothetical protein